MTSTPKQVSDHHQPSSTPQSEFTAPTSESTTPVPLQNDQTYPPSDNPWDESPSDSLGTKTPEEPEYNRLQPPDPTSLFEQPVVAGFEAESAVAPVSSVAVNKEILNEFDPLVSSEERAARDAWESSEAHPPPPHSSPPPAPPKDDLVPPRSVPPDSLGLGTPRPSSAFPSLASLARSFSITSLSRSRPQSLDAAKTVPSPTTLSLFASQQDAPPDETETARNISRSGTPIQSVSGTATPRDKNETAFDFQTFLDQMKTRSAEPVSKYLRSFLSNFAKRTFTVNDQVKIINDFLNFISVQMRNCDAWKNATDAEFENAMEGMEKLVMNRLYEFTFTPQVVHAIPPRPITTDDLERDRVLSQRIALFGWLEEKHLDIPEGEGSKGFLMFAQQELLKINHYKAPRDKLICILNCCKVIFGLIRHLRKDEGADSFVPILIFVVLKANPENLLSNVEFINRFRNPEKLQSEAGYYLSSLMGAVSFIEAMDHTSLSNISQEEFEKQVEKAIQALPPSEPQSPMTPQASRIAPFPSPSNLSPHAGEESAQPLSISTPVQALSEDARRLLQKTGDTISKPLNAIGRIFTEALDGAENKLAYLPGPFAPFELGRESRLDQAGLTSGQAPQVPYMTHPGVWQQNTPQAGGGAGVYVPPISTPYKARVRRGSPSSSFQSPASPGYGPEDTPSRPGPHQPRAGSPSQSLFPQSLAPPRVQTLAGGGDGARISRTPTPSLDIAGVQAEIDQAHEQAAAAAKETLTQIFPGMDVEIVQLVLEANNGDLGKSIEGLLEMSSGS